MSAARWPTVLGLLLAGCTCGRSAAADPPGGATPGAVVKRYLAAIRDGDPENVAACFDQTDEVQKAGSGLHTQIADVVRAYRKLQKAAADKFGEGGVRAVREKVRPGEGEPDPLAVDDRARAEVRVFDRTDSDTAFAVLKGREDDYWRLRKKGGRWYIALSKTEVVVAALMGGAVANLKENVDRATELVKESRTVEEFAAKMEKFRQEVEKKRTVK